MSKSFVRIEKDNVPDLAKILADLADVMVLVGIPQENTRRPGEPITNAEIGFIHNFGAPEANIPQREFMAPGIHVVLPQITDGLRTAALAALDGNKSNMEGALHAVGIVAATSIKKTIIADIPPPLAPATVAARIARRKSPSWRAKRRKLVAANVAANKPPGAGIFTALIDTASLLNSITYVIERVRSGISTVARMP